MNILPPRNTMATRGATYSPVRKGRVLIYGASAVIAIAALSSPAMSIEAKLSRVTSKLSANRIVARIAIPIRNVMYFGTFGNVLCQAKSLERACVMCVSRLPSRQAFLKCSVERLNCFCLFAQKRCVFFCLLGGDFGLMLDRPRAFLIVCRTRFNHDTEHDDKEHCVFVHDISSSVAQGATLEPIEISADCQSRGGLVPLGKVRKGLERC